MDQTSSQPPPRALLALVALGVVYGDIGTSPLYAVRECFFGSLGVAPVRANVLGVLSLVTWSLLLVVSLKYLVFVLNADYQGEGGILALMALVRRRARDGHGHDAWILWLGLFGAALLYGDGMITPAISVLSAVEGIEVAAPHLGGWVLPITITILVFLFALQPLGTAGVGRLFGPVMLLWFGSLALWGSLALLDHPQVLAALDPRHGLSFLWANGVRGLTILGIVFLVVTGGEVLYADLGHFGKGTIRLGWYVVVLPSLLLNYFGQGALILARPGEITNPCFQLAPAWAFWPSVVLATAATVIASQAVISGSFSLTSQAMHLGYLPRLQVHHTSRDERGQIYVPAVNWLLLAATVGLVLGFRSSGALAAAYGIAIAATMSITTVLLYTALSGVYGWRRATAAPLCGLFLGCDLAFLSANLLKFLKGGWVALGVAALLVLVMATWRQGQARERRLIHDLEVEPPEFLRQLGGAAYRRVPGQAIYLTRNPRGTPRVLAQNLRHNRALHRQVLLVTVLQVRRPVVPEDERVRVETLREDLHRVVIHTGFVQETCLPRLLERVVREEGLDLDLERATYFVGGAFRIPSGEEGLGTLRSRGYAFLARNARRPTAHFDLPAGQVVELSTQLHV